LGCGRYTGVNHFAVRGRERESFGGRRERRPRVSLAPQTSHFITESAAGRRPNSPADARPAAARTPRDALRARRTRPNRSLPAFQPIRDGPALLLGRRPAPLGSPSCSASVNNATGFWLCGISPTSVSRSVRLTLQHQGIVARPPSSDTATGRARNHGGRTRRLKPHHEPPPANRTTPIACDNGQATTFRKPGVWQHGTITSLGAKPREFPATN
jgi:hypothetical protein